MKNHIHFLDDYLSVENLGLVNAPKTGLEEQTMWQV